MLFLRTFSSVHIRVQECVPNRVPYFTHDLMREGEVRYSLAQTHVWEF